MPINFEFATANRVVFGRGKIKEAGALVKGFGSRALVLTGSDMKRAAPLTSQLEEQGTRLAVIPVRGEPALSTVETAVALGRAERIEVVIAIGGGSAIDAGKAVAAMLTHSGALLHYLEVVGLGKTLERPSAPFIAIPTTAGTGSEVTRNAVLASPEHRVKVSLRSVHMLPRVALVDPELTIALPRQVTATTGLDALTQLIEPFVCTRANPMVDALCLEGIRRAARALPLVCRDLQNFEAREDMSLASLIGGIALANAGLGAVHGFAGPLGGMFPAPHGALCAALLPPVVAANIRALRARNPGSDALRRFETIARILTAKARARAEDSSAWLEELVRTLEVPPLRTYGIKPEHFPEVVAKARQASSMKPNPIELEDQELMSILEAAH